MSAMPIQGGKADGEGRGLPARNPGDAIREFLLPGDHPCRRCQRRLFRRAGLIGGGLPVDHLKRRLARHGRTQRRTGRKQAFVNSGARRVSDLHCPAGGEHQAR